MVGWFVGCRGSAFEVLGGTVGEVFHVGGRTDTKTRVLVSSGITECDRLVKDTRPKTGFRHDLGVLVNSFRTLKGNVPPLPLDGFLCALRTLLSVESGSGRLGSRTETTEPRGSRPGPQEWKLVSIDLRIRLYKGNTNFVVRLYPTRLTRLQKSKQDRRNRVFDLDGSLGCQRSHGTCPTLR